MHAREDQHGGPAATSTKPVRPSTKAPPALGGSSLASPVAALPVQLADLQRLAGNQAVARAVADDRRLSRPGTSGAHAATSVQRMPLGFGRSRSRYVSQRIPGLHGRSFLSREEHAEGAGMWNYRSVDMIGIMDAATGAVTYERAPWAGNPVYVTNNHGNAEALQFHRDNAEESPEVHQDAQVLASELGRRNSFNEIRSQPGGCVVLGACLAGSVDGGIAQKAADELGMSVWAANTEVSFYPNENAPLVLWKHDPDHDVRWIKFRPQSRRRRRFGVGSSGSRSNYYRGEV